MPNDAELIIKLRADLDQANKQISNFTKNAERQADQVKKSFDGLKIVAGAAVAAFASAKIVGSINNVIDAAKIQEDAVNSLNTALKLSGDFSTDASEDIQEYASSLQSVTTVGDETTLQLFALGKAFGRSNEQTKDLTTAAIELSAATGIDARTAIEQLGGTLAGTTGRLGKTIPALKGLSKEALLSGEAIQLVLDRFSGSAASKLQTFSGAVTAVSNSFGDLLEELGFIVTRNTAVIASLNAIQRVLSDFGKIVGENRSGVEVFVTASVRFFALLASNAASAFQKITTGVVAFLTLLKAGNVAIAEFQRDVLGADNLDDFIDRQNNAILKLAEFEQSVKDATDSIQINAAEAIGEIEKIGKETEMSTDKASEGFKKPIEPLKNLAKEAKEAKKAFDPLFDSLENVERIQNPLSDTQLKEVFDRKLLRESQSQYESFLQEREKSDKESLRSAQGEYEKFLKEQKNLQKKQQDEIAKNFTQNAFGDEIANSTLGGLATGGQALGSIVSGDAAGFVAGAGGLAVDAFLPGLGGVASQLLGILSGGPEVVKANIEAFVEQLPVIIEAIVESIPVVAEALADNADIIILRLAEAMPRVAVALGEAAVKVIGRLLENLFREITVGFLGGISKGIGNIFSELFKAFEPLFESLNKVGQAFTSIGNVFSQITSALSGLIDRINDALSGDLDTGIRIGGSLGRFTEGLKQGRFSFQTGLTEVPQGFPNDSFPANLTSGERVVDAETNQDLKEFLRNQSGGGQSKMIKINLQVGQTQLADVIYELNQNGFRTA